MRACARHEGIVCAPGEAWVNITKADLPYVTRGAASPDRTRIEWPGGGRVGGLRPVRSGVPFAGFPV